ncbi:FtsX-like permease family protein [Patulibacter sp. SYSU D01012]|uniref:FtsX-like permease family protein n=1 Tax=Patulibacter sp. SYSU D01012 TaxID=2817381 RepID=UPI001B317003|nr:FtsX-like permease family protein [Patulibacter sp. SYSU D01012]
MSALAFALRIWRRDRTTRRGAALTAAAIGVAAALIVALAAVPGALERRADRVAWRGGDPSELVETHTTALDPRTAPVLVSTTAYEVGGRTIQQIGIATRRRIAPPAGLPRVPAPGEVLVSPAVHRLLDGPDGDALRASLPGRVVGTVGDAALTGPEERVVVAGLRPAALAGIVSDTNGTTVAAVGALRGATAEAAPFYVALVWIALALLVLPTVALAMQIARLLATRREERTAALQLVGADPVWTLRAAVAETALAAAAGALVGVLVGLPVARFALVHVSFNGTTWFAGDLTSPTAIVLAALLGLPALTALGTAVAQRRTGGALGTIQRHRPKPLSPARLLLLPVAATAMVWGLRSLDGEGTVLPLLIALASVVLATSVVGPWVVLAFGQVIRTLWRRPATLLAARRMIDEPRAVWRIASGPVLAAFVAATMLGAAPTMEDAQDVTATPFGERHLVVPLDARQAPDAAAAVARRLGPGARVGLYPTGADGTSAPLSARAARREAEVDLVIATGRDAGARDRAAAAVARELPGAGAAGAGRTDPRIGIVRTIFAGAAGTLVLASLLAALATAVTSVGSVLDRRRTLAALRMAGTPVGVLRRTMQREVALPTVLGVVLSGAAGALFSAALITVGGSDPIDVLNLPLVAALAVGAGLPVLAVRAAGTTIERVTDGGPAAE